MPRIMSPQKASRFAFFLLVFFLVLATAWLARIRFLEKQRAHLENLTVEELLDRLLEEKPCVFGDSNGHRFYPFASEPLQFASDEEFDPWLTELHRQANVKGHTVLAELVRRGVTALPHLLEHLEDNRPTRWVVRSTPWVFKGEVFEDPMIFGNGYDARNLDPRKHPPGTVAIRFATDLTLPDPGPEETEILDPPLTSYTLKVGDVCSMMIGEIVNRRLDVVHRVVGGMMISTIIQSPVHTPALAKACRDDWAGLTPEEHKQSLLNDANQHDLGTRLCAIDRLVYYYPKEAEDLLVKLLKRPLYDEEKILDFFDSRLLKLSPSTQSKLQGYIYTAKSLEHEKQCISKRLCECPSFLATTFIDYLNEIQFDDHELHKYAARQITEIDRPNYYKELISQFKSELKDDSWVTIPYWLHNVCEIDPMHIDILLYGKAALANQIRELAFPDYDPFHPYFIDAVSPFEQGKLLMFLRPFSSPRVDQAIHDLFRKAIEPNPLFEDSPDWGRFLASQCVKHLAGKSYDPDLRAYLEGRIKKPKEGPDPDDTDSERKNLKRLLQKLRL